MRRHFAVRLLDQASKSRRSVRVLLADDNALFREGIASLLASCEDVQVVGQARDAEDVARKAAIQLPDVELMDVAMPMGGGTGATRKILSARPDQAICILAVSDQAENLYLAVRAGARGYLVKTVDLEDLCAGLRVLATGGAVVMPRLAADLLDEFAKLAQAVREGPGEADKLTGREREVLELVARGASNKEIAQALVIAENTVKVHLRNILDKLHLLHRRDDGDDDGLFRSGVPRRPAPGGLAAEAEAAPDLGTN